MKEDELGAKRMWQVEDRMADYLKKDLLICDYFAGTQWDKDIKAQLEKKSSYAEQIRNARKTISPMSSGPGPFARALLFGRGVCKSEITQVMEELARQKPGEIVEVRDAGSFNGLSHDSLVFDEYYKQPRDRLLLLCP